MIWVLRKSHTKKPCPGKIRALGGEPSDATCTDCRPQQFTRTALIFAEELAVAYELRPIYDMTSVHPDDFGGNPALKLPTLRLPDDRAVFGTQNVCRALEELPNPRRFVYWAEAAEDELLANAHELTLHAMSARVQIVFGTMVVKLPGDSIFFSKAQVGFEKPLQWLDEHAQTILQTLPRRDFSFIEVALYCLLGHLQFRQTLSTDPFTNLGLFHQQFGERDSVKRTPYQFDQPARPTEN